LAKAKTRGGKAKASDEKFPEIFTGGNFPYMLAHRFLLAYFLPYYLCFGNFFHIIYVFIVLSMFWESFRKFSSLAKAMDLTVKAKAKKFWF
jgi:hypothetical protein